MIEKNVKNVNKTRNTYLLCKFVLVVVFLIVARQKSGKASSIKVKVTSEEQKVTGQKKRIFLSKVVNTNNTITQNQECVVQGE